MRNLKLTLMMLGICLSLTSISEAGLFGRNRGGGASCGQPACCPAPAPSCESGGRKLFGRKAKNCCQPEVTCCSPAPVSTCCVAPAPAPCCSPAPAPTCCEAPAPTCCEAPAPTCCEAPVPTCCEAPAPTCCEAPAPTCCEATAPTCCEAPAPTCCEAPAPTCCDSGCKKPGVIRRIHDAKMQMIRNVAGKMRSRGGNSCGCETSCGCN